MQRSRRSNPGAEPLAWPRKRREMDETQPLLFVLGLSTLSAFIVARTFPREERLSVVGSWLIHVASALTIDWIYLNHYGGGDMVQYTRTGVELAAVLRQNPIGFAPELLRLLFHQDVPLPVLVIGAGSSTGSMSALSAFSLFLFGGYVFTNCVVFAFASYLGKVALYAAFRRVFASDQRGGVMLSTLFLPSYVFWSSAPLKEAVAIAGLGSLVLGLALVSRTSYVRGGVAALLGVLVVGLVKPYILVAAGVALSAWFYSTRAARNGKVRHDPLAIVVAVALGFVALVGVGTLFEDLSLERVAETTSVQQEASSTVTANSNYTVGNAGEENRSLAGQLAFAPLALLFALFRPFPTDVNNALMAVNAIESTWVIYLFLRMSLRRSPAVTLQRILANPWLAFCAVFTIVLGIGVGLATTNMGTLSRYRIPLMPFFVMLLFALGKRDSVAQVAASSALRRSHA